jgi:hypothetical protein
MILGKGGVFSEKRTLGRLLSLDKDVQVLIGMNCHCAPRYCGNWHQTIMFHSTRTLAEHCANIRQFRAKKRTLQGYKKQVSHLLKTNKAKT